jgi:hypothetical protein
MQRREENCKITNLKRKNAIQQPPMPERNKKGSPIFENYDYLFYF